MKQNAPIEKKRRAEENARKAELVGQTRAEFVKEAGKGGPRGDRMRASREYDERVKRAQAWEKAAPVYQELMGREMDDAAKATVLDMGLKNATRHWATSSEALGRGIDPTKYGARAVDEESISEKNRPYYDEWRKRNPGQPLYNTTLEYFNWARGQGDVNAFTAELDGLIVDHYIGGQRVRQITPEAVQRMGGEVTIRGTKAGVAWIAPEGTKWHGGNTWETTEKGDGQVVRIALGNPSDGVFGLGSDALKWLPNEVSAPLNLLTANTLPRILGGTDSLRTERRDQRRIFGDSVVEFLEPLSEMVITTAATVAAGPKGTAVASSVFQGSRALSGEQGWGDAALRVVAATAPVVGAKYYGAVGAGIGTAAGVTAGRIVGDKDLNPFLIAASGLTAYTFAPYLGHWSTNALSAGIQATITGGPILASTVMGAAGGMGHWTNFSVAAAGALLDSDNLESYAHLAMGNLIETQFGSRGETGLTTREALQGTWDHLRNPGQAWSEFRDAVTPPPKINVEPPQSTVWENPFPPVGEMDPDLRSRISRENRERMLRPSEAAKRDRDWVDGIREADRIREANSYQGPRSWGR